MCLSFCKYISFSHRLSNWNAFDWLEDDSLKSRVEIEFLELLDSLLSEQASTSVHGSRGSVGAARHMSLSGVNIQDLSFDSTHLSRFPALNAAPASVLAARASLLRLLSFRVEKFVYIVLFYHLSFSLSSKYRFSLYFVLLCFVSCERVR